MMFLLLIACVCVFLGLAFLEAVRSASIVPENGTAPTRYILNSLWFLLLYVYVSTVLLVIGDKDVIFC